MSDNNGESNFQSAQAFSRLWMDMASAMMNAGTANSGQAPPMPPEAVRQMRSVMLEAMSSYCEQFMRSKEFLEMTKQSLSNAIAFRQQMNEMMAQIQHDWHGAGRDDIDQVLASFSNAQDRLSDQLEGIASSLGRLEQRIEDVNKRLDKLENKPATRSSTTNTVSGRSTTSKRTKSGKSAASSAKRKSVKKKTTLK